MPLVAAGVCPSSPVLLPELATAAGGGLDDLRTVCDAAVAELWSARPQLVAVVGLGARTGESPPPYRGSFTPWGAAMPVGDAGPPECAELALDSAPAADLRAGGRPPWQVLAGAAAARRWHSLLRYADFPYGVGYFVASRS